MKTMPIFRKVMQNTAIQVGGSTFNTLIGLVITAALARYLGQVGYGEYSLVFVYFFFAGVVANLGFDTILVRELAKVEDISTKEAKTLISNTILLKLLFSCLAVVGFITYLSFKTYPFQLKSAAILLSLTLFLGAFESIETVFKVKLDIKYNVFASLTSQTTHLLLVLLSIYFKSGLLGIIGAYFLARLVRVVLVFKFSTKYLTFRFIRDRKLQKFLFNESFPLGIATGLWIIYYRIDMLMLDYFKGVGAVGQYSAAYKIVDLFLLLSGMVMVSVYPLMSAAYPCDMEMLKKLYQKSIDYLSILGSTLTFLVLISADYLIKLIYGAKFMNSILTLQILAWVGIFVFISNVYGHMLIVLGMQKKEYLLIRSLGVVVNIYLNLRLIPYWGADGAAIATLVTEFLIFALAPFFIKNKISFLPSFKNVYFSITVVLLPSLVYLQTPGKTLGAFVLFLILTLSLYRISYREMWYFFKKGKQQDLL